MNSLIRQHNTGDFASRFARQFKILEMTKSMNEREGETGVFLIFKIRSCMSRIRKDDTISAIENRDDKPELASYLLRKTKIMKSI